MNTRGLVRYCAILFALLSALALGAVSQSQGGRISFSILKEDNDIVHVSQLEFRVISGDVSISSSVGLTRRTELRFAAGSTFERTLFLGNETFESQQFTVVLLVNDQQQVFGLDGSTKAAHIVELPANEQVRMSLEVPVPQESGLHNAMVVVFYDVGFSDGSFSGGIFTPYADSLIVGEGAVPSQSNAHPGADAFVQGVTVPATMTLPPRGLTISRSSTPSVENELLNAVSLSAQSSLDGFVHVRNGIPRQGSFDEFALIALLDGAQVPVNDSQNLVVANFALPINGLASIPINISAPDSAERVDLDLIAIRNPYGFLGTTGGALEVLHHRVVLDVN